MGQLHNEIRRQELTRAWAAFNGGTRDDIRLERAGETLTPIVDLWGRIENWILRAEQPWSLFQAVAAGGAGTFVRLGVFNPAGSNLLVVVTHHCIQTAVAGTPIGLFQNQTILGNSATVFTRDTRDPSSRGARIQFDTSAAALPNEQFELVPLISSLYQLEIVLSPGNGFVWRTTDDAAGMNASFAGYQRPLKLSELQPGR